MAELVDAPASGAGILTGVEVRVFSWAPKINNIPHGLNLAGFLLLPEGGCEAIVAAKPERISFQHTATRRWLPMPRTSTTPHSKFQHTATRRWLPPTSQTARLQMPFQHTATRRWLPVQTGVRIYRSVVSTHSHPKVAAERCSEYTITGQVSTHSHPKVAAPNRAPGQPAPPVSTHSHPKVAALVSHLSRPYPEFQHTATRRWLLTHLFRMARIRAFQHTATRRWLPSRVSAASVSLSFQHTATRRWLLLITLQARHNMRFNTQPPEGGCLYP